MSSGSAPPPAAAGQLSVVDGLAQLAFVVHGSLERQAAAHDLSMSQARLLGILRDRRPTMNELGRLLGLDKSSVSGLVDRAERRGLVTRLPSAEDRRVVLVGLTDQGSSLVSRVAAGFAAEIVAMLRLVPPADRDELAGVVSQLLVAHAAEQGVDLFAGLLDDPPTAGVRAGQPAPISARSRPIRYNPPEAAPPDGRTRPR
jgi:MarR family transcriptional regulator, lower aerobic nicotinate degradation pathway regulator